jgi:hypothetical protein
VEIRPGIGTWCNYETELCKQPKNMVVRGEYVVTVDIAFPGDCMRQHAKPHSIDVQCVSLISYIVI